MAPLRDDRPSLAQKRPESTASQAPSSVAPVTAGAGSRGARSLVAWSAGPSRTGGEAQSNRLGPGIERASDPDCGPGGSWSTCTNGCEPRRRLYGSEKVRRSR
jgi:hypothetical protein